MALEMCDDLKCRRLVQTIWHQTSFTRIENVRKRRNLMRLLSFLLGLCIPGLLTISSPAEAACSGSGTTWSCTAGSSASEINAAITSASDGATITFAAGTYSASGISLNPRNAVTLICASEESCNMTATQVFSASHSTTKTGLVRISGFLFSNTNGAPTISLGYASGNPGYTKLRIDNNRFKQTAGISIATGHTQSTLSVLGVIDHNTFEGSTHNYPLIIFGGGNNDWGPSHQGTGNNLFIEDNTFNYANENLAASGMDVWNGGRVVVRYNSITNARVAVHGYCHGGPANLEVYNNTLVGGSGSSNGYRIVHHQGSGEFMVFGNRLSPSGASMSLLFYPASNPNPEGCGSVTAGNYPIAKQPGRTGNNTLRPIYLWNNALSSGGAKVGINLDSAGGTSILEQIVMKNRDWFEAVSNSAQSSASSPFNGTTGMGFGMLANRPTTCSIGTTTGLLAADAGKGGVGYFATDAGPQGTLYRCSAANTWTAHYTPYTYPHPLQTSGGGGGEAITPPPAPSNLSVQ